MTTTLTARQAMRMPVPEPAPPRRTIDKAQIRALLNSDRDWSLYALADLDEPLFQQCDWWTIPGALTLVFRGISIRPIFVFGDAEPVRRLLAHLPDRTGYLNLREDQIAAAKGLFRYRDRHHMHRMILEHFKPLRGETIKLGPSNLTDIERLYSTGDGGGIAFAPFQLETGFFRGVRHGGELVAVAGVQAVSISEGVAAVGNIFTRPDCRGQRLAQITTSAVVGALVNSGIATIGLNVEADNTPALRAYEKIGFVTRFTYFEGPAERVES